VRSDGRAGARRDRLPSLTPRPLLQARAQHVEHQERMVDVLRGERRRAAVRAGAGGKRRRRRERALVYAAREWGRVCEDGCAGPVRREGYGAG
jgi:hypothetical protein